MHKVDIGESGRRKSEGMRTNNPRKEKEEAEFCRWRFLRWDGMVWKYLIPGGWRNGLSGKQKMECEDLRLHAWLPQLSLRFRDNWQVRQRLIHVVGIACPI